MSNNDTQPLVEPIPDAFPWNSLHKEYIGPNDRIINPELQKDAREMMQEAYERIHVHGPFVFLMNQNHNALRGCVTCGATWVGLMAGEAKGLMWHPVGELPEEEEE